MHVRHHPWSVILAAAVLGVLGAVAIGLQPYFWVEHFWQYHGRPSLWRETLRAPGMTTELITACVGTAVVGLGMVVCAISALLLRRPLGHRALNGAFLLTYLLFLVVIDGIAKFNEVYVQLDLLAAEDDGTNRKVEAFSRLLGMVWGPLVLLPGILIWQILCNRAHIYASYARELPKAGAFGDRVIESLRSGGREIGYRKAWYGSILVHLAIIIASLIHVRGCIEPYKIPDGSGTPATPPTVAKKIEVKKEVILYAEDSPIIFITPKITDSQVVEEIQKESEEEYETTAAGAPGAVGEDGGEEGGWPDGVPGGELRFIRIQYNGEDWDDGLHRTNADKNFLARIQKLPSVKFPVRAYGESHPIDSLQDYPKGQAPPFMYMTGSRNISISDSEIRTLRDYLEDGGMLFADCGSPAWHSAFTRFIKRVFPAKDLVRISDDDIIFRQPNKFPHGIDPLWHHGGKHAMGIKHKGRWAVFYHPGDINDCWKDDAMSIPKAVRDNAFNVGFNVIYYALTRYLEETAKYRKK